MSDYHFASELRRQDDLPLQIAEAAKEWRLAALDCDQALEEWHAEAAPQKKEAQLLSRVTTAQILLLLEMGRLFGLVDDNLEVDVQSCLDTLEEGREKGVTPDPKTFLQSAPC